jgi:hypothetical protein
MDEKENKERKTDGAEDRNCETKKLRKYKNKENIIFSIALSDHIFIK